MKRLLLRSALATILCITPLAAIAQDSDTDTGLEDRMDRLERDLVLMQRQTARDNSGTYSTARPAASSGPITNGGQLDVRLTDMEERMRRLQGDVEQTQFQNKQTADALKKYMEDAEFRFQKLEGAHAAPAAAAEPSDAPAIPSEAPRKTGTLGGAHTDATPDALPVDELPATPDAAPAVKANETPKEMYDRGFALLRQSKHAEAAAVFETFVKKYPTDALTGNAFYWLGETYYVRRDYVKSADYFRQGYKAAPTGAKAADNLLKLSMALSGQKKNKEACIVLAQIGKKFSAAPDTLKQKTAQEIERNKCDQ